MPGPNNSDAQSASKSPSKPSSDANPNSNPTAPLAADVDAKLRLTLSLLQGVPTARMVWNKLLTEQERLNLGGDFEACYQRFNGILRIWLHLHKVWNRRAVIDIARGIGLLSESDYQWLDLEISKVDPMLPAIRRAAAQSNKLRGDENKITKAAASHRLVLVRGGPYHRLYWEGQWLRKEWGSVPLIWELLWSLVDRAKSNRPTGWGIVGTKSPEAMVDLRSRLKKYIPTDLNNLIESLGEWQYQLKLDISEIKLFELTEDEWLSESDCDSAGEPSVREKLAEDKRSSRVDVKQADVSKALGRQMRW